MVESEDIARVVQGWAGIPVTRMLESEVQKLTRMEDNIHQRIVGQANAVRAVSDAIRRNRAGLKGTNASHRLVHLSRGPPASARRSSRRLSPSFFSTTKSVSFGST